MPEELYLKDSYLKEFEAEVMGVSKEKFIILDRTAFYATSGGQPWDEGVMRTENDEFKVVYVGKFDGKISHEVDKPGLKVGEKVKCEIDWERRYRLMKMHTATHILSEVIYKDTGSLITGGQLGIEKSRMDFNLLEYDPEKIRGYIDRANELIGKDLKISVEFLPREEAMKLPQVSKLAKGLPESLKEIRIVKIGDYDMQADGGTHVKSTNEIGKIKLLKIDNRGKNNRRIYYTLE